MREASSLIPFPLLPLPPDFRFRFQTRKGIATDDNSAGPGKKKILSCKNFAGERNEMHHHIMYHPYDTRRQTAPFLSFSFFFAH